MHAGIFWFHWFLSTHMEQRNKPLQQMCYNGIWRKDVTKVTAARTVKLQNQQQIFLSSYFIITPNIMAV
jgi:hypothetical protein